MHQISWTNNWENKQIPNLLYQGRNDESLCVYFHLYEPVAKIKLSKYSGRVWLLSLPFCIQTKMICKTECLLCPTGPRYTYRKKGQSFFFFFLLLAVKKNILMHRHFWLCVKLSNPAPYFRLRYLLLFLPSLGEPVPFRTDFNFTGNGCVTKIYS